MKKISNHKIQVCFLFIFISFSISFNCAGQNKDSLFIDLSKHFKGGEEAFNKYEVYTRYPPLAREVGVHGTVILGFILTKEGKIENIKIINSIGAGCDEEAIKTLMKYDGKLNPAAINNLPIDKYYEFKLNFILY
jgi:periplasmic protein TonB